MILELCIVSALIAYYLEACMEEGNILHFWKLWIGGLPENISKPLGNCILCFSFWVGIIIGIICCMSGYISYISVPIVGLGCGGATLAIKRIEGVFYESED